MAPIIRGVTNWPCGDAVPPHPPGRLEASHIAYDSTDSLFKIFSWNAFYTAIGGYVFTTALFLMDVKNIKYTNIVKSMYVYLNIQITFRCLFERIPKIKSGIAKKYSIFKYLLNNIK